MYLDKEDYNDILCFLKGYKKNYTDILSIEFSTISKDCLTHIQIEIFKIDNLIKKITKLIKEGA